MKITSNPSLKIGSKLALAGLLAAGVITFVPHTEAYAASATKAAASAPSAAPGTSAQTGSAYIKSIYNLAKQGKIPGIDAIAGKTSISAIHKKWGKPTAGDSTGNHYEFYNFGMGQGAFAFGVNKSGIIYDLRNFGESVDPSVGIKSLTFSSVESTLGKPKAIRFNGSDKIYVYQPAAGYELKFVGPKTVAKGKTAHIDHINVYAAKAAKP